jgi:hypothetical protein
MKETIALYILLEIHLYKNLYRLYLKTHVLYKEIWLYIL